MSKGTALITGLNGYLAGPTAEAVLNAGFNVRGSVRRLESGYPIKQELERRGYSGRVEIVETPDITVEGAFDKAVEGCSAIFHLAGPVNDVFILKATQVVETSIRSIKGLLNSADQHAGPQLKSIVLVSSMSAVSYIDGEARAFTEKEWNETAPKMYTEEGDKASPIIAYQAGKTLAEREFWRFHEEKNHTFSMTAVQPVWVIGPSLLPIERPENICYSLNHIRGYLMEGKVQNSMEGFNSFIDIRDLGRILVWAVTTTDVADGQRYACSTFEGSGQAVADILWKKAPEIAEGLEKGTPGKGYKADHTPVGDLGWADGSKVAKATGFEWIPYEQSVIDSAKSLIAFKKKE